MYVVRDIFQLKFGHFKDAKALLDEVKEKDMLPKDVDRRMLSDFTGDAYRLVLEQSFNSLAEYEQHLQGTMSKPEFQQWYGQFKEHVESSHREILKQIG